MGAQSFQSIKERGARRENVPHPARDTSDSSSAFERKRDAHLKQSLLSFPAVLPKMSLQFLLTSFQFFMQQGSATVPGSLQNIPGYLLL